MIDLNDIQTKQNLIEDIIDSNHGTGIVFFVWDLLAESSRRNRLDCFYLEAIGDVARNLILLKQKEAESKNEA